MFILVYLGAELFDSFYDLILNVDLSTLLVQECDQSVLAEILRSSDFLQAV